MVNKTENRESQTERSEKNQNFFQKNNFKTLNHYLEITGCASAKVDVLTEVSPDV